jgi:Txe/YoeB family toxin of Txe-Axe toxin-antitoxin module
MAEELAEKQAEYYREVSAKTSANIEDLFNKIIDDLLALTKKKEPVAQNSNEP